MSLFYERKGIREGIAVNTLRDSKFTQSSLSVYFIFPLEEGKTSRAALVPGMLRTGSRACPGLPALERRLDDLYGASLEPSVLRRGGLHLIALTVTGIDDRFALSSGERISSGCEDLLTEVLFHPDMGENGFFEKSFRTEQRWLTDSIRAELNDKRRYAVNRCLRLMGGGGRFSVSKLGSAGEAAAVTPRDVRAAYRRILRGSRIEVFRSGRWGEHAAGGPLESALRSCPRAPEIRPPETPAPRTGAVSRVTEPMPLAQSKLVMGFRTGSMETSRRKAALRLMTALLGGASGSRFFTRIRETLGICYYCSARVDLMTGILIVESGIEASRREALEEAVLDQIGDIAAAHITDAEFRETRLEFAHSLLSLGDSLERTEDWYLSGLLQEDAVSPQEDILRIFSVTKEEIAEAARGLTLDTSFLLEAEEEKKA